MTVDSPTMNTGSRSIRLCLSSVESIPGLLHYNHTEIHWDICSIQSQQNSSNIECIHKHINNKMFLELLYNILFEYLFTKLRGHLPVKFLKMAIFLATGYARILSLFNSFMPLYPCYNVHFRKEEVKDIILLFLWSAMRVVHKKELKWWVADFNLYVVISGGYL